MSLVHKSQSYILPSLLVKMGRGMAFSALLLCSLTLFLGSCSSDDDEDGTDLTANRNTNLVTDPEEAMRLEIPKLKGGVVNQFLVKRISSGEVNFCIEWDISKKAQRWTAFRWDTSYRDDNIGRTEAWAVDTDIDVAFQTSSDNYSGSGYTRGHMIASEDRQQKPLEYNEQTFLYSNMQPQLYSFNVGIWANLEKKVRSWNTADFRDTLYVAKGGTIDHNSDLLEITSTGLRVPKYFFMAILCKNKSTVNGGYKAIGFFLEHRSFYEDEKNFTPYIVSIDELEKLTGIDFFCNLPDYIEDKVEATVTPTLWGFSAGT